MTLPGVTLVMDAAAGNGTIAVLRDGVLVVEADVVMRSAAEERFFPAVQDTLARAGATLADLRQLVVGAGPGSFTALRVVGAIAKGIAQARDIPMYAVPSLALTAGGARTVVTLDALRGERYAALVERDADGRVQRVEQLGLWPAAEVDARAAALQATPLAADATVPSQAAPLAGDVATALHARNAVACAALAIAAGPVDLARWEPMYGRLAEAQVKWEAAHGRPLA
ncbi:MAG TPA: tRNA (adenosine(37)-N6)-threonylcarbamoyltransferase complex dimerization subunit type 1 TsaB [Gemmatimonadaceae bacterium]|nr:tRNA (adenosine(37)-N6)-threonylcarbamoyltransferase complex dimerization subunit type 1 TsaB [Gemmatimonadaceae bacterium]HRQ79305.1 tRNA (adenosine(37)-N6)-threonylcarbamoyltransferase complex dimerization subunit type 1 TsaB [Gemmatimonadaceae bacterium]